MWQGVMEGARPRPAHTHAEDPWCRDRGRSCDADGWGCWGEERTEAAAGDEYAGVGWRHLCFLCAMAAGHLPHRARQC